MSHLDQSPATIVMVRPHHFFPNEETAADNAFQSAAAHDERNAIQILAQQEFDQAVAILRQEGVEVLVFDDRADVVTPDSVFPNNWISFHHDGTIILYPMMASNRRLERRADITADMAKTFKVTDVWDISAAENDGRALEGTGAIVFDHGARVAYMARSCRADEDLLTELCARLGYQSLTFDSVGPDGEAIYHTNVIMGIGERVALIGLSSIPNGDEQARVRDALLKSGKEIVDLSPEQIGQFAGNVFELDTPTGKLIALSETAYQALTEGQVQQIEQYARLCPLSVPTIEKSGGSVRCMMAAVHLPPLD